MHVLCVAPSETSSGEAITALDVARDLVDAGDNVHFLGSTYTCAFARAALPDGCTTTLGPDRSANQALWTSLLESFRPDAIIFADYPLLFFRSGTAPLLDANWSEQLSAGHTPVMTLDCLGYAQRAQRVFFGPPHLSAQFEDIGTVPESMNILLPCPPHDPQPRARRRGLPFRSAMPRHAVEPIASEDIRRRYASDDELLVVHVTSAWACEWAERLGLPYYGVLSRILEHYLRGIPRPATIVSINNGRLLQPATRPNVRVQNLSSLDPADFERLLGIADLVVGENRVSVTLARAASALRPTIVLVNSFRVLELPPSLHPVLRNIVNEMEQKRRGAVFPYVVFPIWSAADLTELGFPSDNAQRNGVCELELFGDETTRERLQRLLLDPSAAGDFPEPSSGLPTGAEVIRGLVERNAVPAGTAR